MRIFREVNARRPSDQPTTLEADTEERHSRMHWLQIKQALTDGGNPGRLVHYYKFKGKFKTLLPPEIARTNL